VDIKIHAVELVSDFLGLQFVTVLVEDLGEDEWDEEHTDSKSEGPSLVFNVSENGLGIPNRELSTASNDNLDVTDVN
jgi:hypothetical protein